MSEEKKERFRGRRVLVTGATGLIGTRLVERLVTCEGAEVADDRLHMCRHVYSFAFQKQPYSLLLNWNGLREETQLPVEITDQVV